VPINFTGAKNMPVRTNPSTPLLWAIPFLANLLTLVLCAGTPAWGVEGGSLPSKRFDSSQSPPNCHALGKEVNFFDRSKLHVVDSKKYDDLSVGLKQDIVCVGSHLIIDRPIFTNGGDIIILAENIDVRAKIDTRVYRPYKLENLFADVDPECVAFRPMNVLAVLMSERTKFTDAFLDYYRCDDCRVIDSKQCRLAWS
jgi:hypothetical protein